MGECCALGYRRQCLAKSPKTADAQSPLLGRVKPCLPMAAPCPPAGPEWLHEIKHDGYRMLAHRDGECARLISRRGLDWAWRFPMIVAAIKALAVRSCIIDGEVIASDGSGLADFELLRHRRQDAAVTLVAFESPPSPSAHLS